MNMNTKPLPTSPQQTPTPLRHSPAVAGVTEDVSGDVRPAVVGGAANISLGHFCSLLVRHRIIDAAAIDNPEGYDGGITAGNCFDAYKEMDTHPGEAPDALELRSELYGVKLNFREVPTDAFVRWYQWRLATCPNTETGIPLKDFDIESAMMFFEDFVKSAKP